MEEPAIKETTMEERCWAKWLEEEEEEDRAGILRAKEFYERYGKTKGFLNILTKEERKHYREFFEEHPRLRGKPLYPLVYKDIRYILPSVPYRITPKNIRPIDQIKFNIFDKVMAYGRVITYKEMLE